MLESHGLLSICYPKPSPSSKESEPTYCWMNSESSSHQNKADFDPGTLRIVNECPTTTLCCLLFVAMHEKLVLALDTRSTWFKSHSTTTTFGSFFLSLFLYLPHAEVGAKVLNHEFLLYSLE